MSENKEQLSPMMAHWRSIKDSQQDALILYRAGDFYEMFFEDAITGSQALDLVLTGKNAGLKEKAPMCGVPARSVNVYIQKLVQLGFKVAIVEQLEDPKQAKGMVKRDVIRVVTPGTYVDSEDDKTTITIASLVDAGLFYYLCFVDMASGYTCVKKIEHTLDGVSVELKTNNCKEVVLPSTSNANLVQSLRQLPHVLLSYCDDTNLKQDYKPLLNDCNDSFIIQGLGCLFNYLEATQKQLLKHLLPIEILDYQQIARLDYSTLANLELTSAPHSLKNQCLWTYLDHCQCAMGSRLLKKWIENPLMDESKINQRLDQVEFLVNNVLIRSSLKEQLANIYDIQRLCARLAMNNANAIDLLRLGKTLITLPNLKQILSNPLFDNLTDFETYDDLAHELVNAIVDTPPVSTKEGGMFKLGYNEALDQIKQAFTDNKQWLITFENQQKELTGIKNLRIVYSRNFGYCIEVSKGQIGLVKDEYGYVRRQTLTNVERYTCQELKEHEDLILNGQARAVALESELFENLRVKCAQLVYPLQRLANCIAAIDCIYALSEVSSSKGFVRPTFSNQLDLVSAKHPLLDKMKNYNSVANDCHMNSKETILLITGPNMGGKSTFMRTVAINALLAQIGCFACAKQAVVPIYDAIYTRIGASDDLFSGQSTFMVEMNEANYALRHATKRSLILFDEIGRGTSTYDGISLAQGMIEYIATNVNCHTLFSTHYHELTALTGLMSTVKNVHAKVLEHQDSIEFTYKIVDGKADRSYGIHVAKLAHLPQFVLDKASTVASQLESKGKVIQPSLFEPSEPVVQIKESETLNAIRDLDPNSLSPLQALQLLYQLKEMADKEA